MTPVLRSYHDRPPPVAATGTAHAQLPGVKGVGLPNLSSMGAVNAAGVLGYCVKNK